jgi:LPXTG-motif cell wall-anchored protein
MRLFRFSVLGASLVGALCVSAAAGAQTGFSAQDDAITTPMDEPVLIDVTANDGIDGLLVDTLEVLVPPSHGDAAPYIDVSLDTEVILYSPDSGFEGADAFSYEVCVTDPNTGQDRVCSQASVAVGVRGSDAPPTSSVPKTTTTPPSHPPTTTSRSDVTIVTAGSATTAASTRPPAAASDTLPRTGTNTGGTFVAAIFVALGSALLAVSRRQRS